jgi:SAM-dependent methyltransferase
MKLEIGGGTKQRGDGWTNIDLVPTADIVHDLNVTPWPLADDSVDAVYSSHCLEHLNGYLPAFNELCRVCRVGAPIEIRVPAPGSDLAMVWDHKYVYAPIAAINGEQFFPRDHWTKPKRMRLDRIGYEPSILLPDARAEMPFLAGMSDEAVMKWFPRTCHECRFYFTVVENEFYGSAA